MENDLSQQKLAEMLNVHQSTIADWEIGRHRPSYEILEKLSKIFNVTVDNLLGLEKD